MLLLGQTFLFIIIAIILICVILNVNYLFELSKKRASQKQLNQEVFKKIIEKYNFDKIFSLKSDISNNENQDDNKSGQLFFANYKNKSVGIVDYVNKRVVIADYKDILNYEIYENSGLQTFGGYAGGAYGGILGSDSSPTCKELYLILRLNQYEVSQVKYELISKTFLNLGINKSSRQYKRILNSLQEFVSFLEIVKSQNKKD